MKAKKKNKKRRKHKKNKTQIGYQNSRPKISLGLLMMESQEIIYKF